MTDDIKEGDYVRFAHSNGSTGKVIKVRDDTGTLYVEWVYGRDAHGGIVHATSSGVRPLEVVKVSVTDYQNAANRRFNSGSPN